MIPAGAAAAKNIRDVTSILMPKKDLARLRMPQYTVGDSFDQDMIRLSTDSNPTL